MSGSLSAAYDGSSKSIQKASYDVVGEYDQDRANGFPTSIIDTMVKCVEPETATSILDAMAGNGNLSERLYNYCKTRGLAIPALTMLELSQQQCQFARKRMAELPIQVICGDILNLADHAGLRLAEGIYDRVMIKSATHELPIENLKGLAKSVFKLLRPGGKWVNLGFIFDDPEERAEIRHYSRLKCKLAGMEDASRNRDFPMREEFYSAMKEAGFQQIQCAMQVQYTVRTSETLKAYFPKERWESVRSELQVQQVKSPALRQKGRLQFFLEDSALLCPGEITLALKPA